MKSNLIDRLYKANIVEGRKESCPRLGFYKPLEVFEGNCYGKKDTLMMKAHWKQNEDDDYNTDFVVDVQLASFILNADMEQRKLINVDQLIGKEMEVTEATYNTATKLFKLSFTISQPDIMDSNTINNMLKSGAYGVLDLVLDEARTSDVVPDFVDDDFPDFLEDDVSDK